MRKLHWIPVMLIPVFSACSIEDDPGINQPKEEVEFIDGTTIVFASQSEAQKLLGTSDEYSKALTKFDIASRTHSAANTEEQNYLDVAAAQALEWQENEIAVLTLLINNVKDKMEDLNLDLNIPKRINLIKSSTQEEGGAVSYTRMDYIVAGGEVTEHYIIHELFHLLTRHNPDKKDALYRTINFEKSNRIEYPAAIVDRVITNPDAPFLDHTINLTINGEQKEAVFILLANKDYSGGSFFDYMEQKLMIVEGSANNKAPVLVNNMPVLYDFAEATDLKQKIGNNTPYTLHPEEILADHFVALVKPNPAPDPEFIEAMKNVLQK